MTNKIKVAVIGAGMMGRNHLNTYAQMNNVELVGVYDIFTDSAKNAAEKFNCKAFATLEEVALNVDAVSVVTPSVTHADVGEFFLNKGIHCLMEKPLATTEVECNRLIKAAKDNNVTLLVGHIERYNPAVEQLSKLLNDTTKTRSLSAKRMSAASGRISDVDAAMDLMIHDVEIIQSLVKSKVTNVKANGVKTPDSPKGADYITAILEFENGVTADITASRMTQARVRTLDVTTDTNYIEMDFIGQSINVHTQGRNPLIPADSIPEWMNYGMKGSMEQLYIPSKQPLSSELSHFVDCINKTATPKISGEDALEALKVIWKVQEEVGLNAALKVAAE